MDFRGLSYYGGMTCRVYFCPSASPELAQSFRRLFQLKLNWPFKDKHHAYIGNYFFNDGLCQRPPINYGAIGVSGSPYDAIFQELVSVFNTREELNAAEKMLDGLFADIARLCI